MNENRPFLPKRILCPMDFSELSDLALKYAVLGAREFNAELTMIHAHFFELPKYFIPKNAEMLSAELQAAKNNILDSLKQHTLQVLGALPDDVKMDFRVMDQQPLETIMDSIKDDAFDLVIMGTHGLGGIKRFFMGSITESVVRESSVPVFTIRQKTHDFIQVQNARIIPQINRVLCPWDLNPTSRPAFDVAVSVAERFKAELTLLHIQEEGEIADADKIQERVCAMVGDIHDLPCRIDIKVRQGNGAEEIVRHAADHQEDIIVLGAVHKSFLEDTFLGRTTELVMRHAPVPVLITPIYTSTEKEKT
jgi:nucleotide-binding universal stress UspA family protein